MNKPSPLGFYVLIEIPAIEEMSEGGIILHKPTAQKEQDATKEGVVVEFGPTCFIDWAGCKQEGKTPAECWGLKVGDKIEFRKFEGMTSATDDRYRYIPDSHIVGVIHD